MELVICVGECCHLNGAEIVVRHLQDRLVEESLDDQVRLKGSFCMGECGEGKEITVKCGDAYLHTAYENVDDFFDDSLLSLIRDTLAQR